MSFPSALRGTLYRVGPGRFERGGTRYASVLDGDGRVDRLHFENGTVTVTSRFVETPQFMAEERAGAILHRRAFGTGGSYRLRSLKNEANTALVYHGGELLALWEGGAASALDPTTLAFLGGHTLGGAASLAPAFTTRHAALDSALGIGGDAVCAHSHVDPATGRRVMLLAQHSLAHTRLRFVEFAADSFLHSERAYTVSGFTHVHDFAVTPSSYVFFTPRLHFDVLSFRAGKSALACVRQHAGDSTLVTLPRTGSARARTHSVHRWFATHLVGARVDEDETCVDAFGIDELCEHPDVRAAACRRFVTGQGSTLLATPTCEFPAAGGHVVYFAGTRHTAMDSLAQMDTATGQTEYLTVEGGVHLEPVVAGDFVLVFVLKDRQQYVRVVERERFTEVCIVRVEGTNFVPYYDRTAIEQGALDGRAPVIAWAADPVELFFLQIQGSGRLRLPDGGVMRIGYATQNGRDYTGIGKLMLDRGILARGEASMQGIMAWLRANPEQGRAIMRENKSYVFFRELTGPGPLGAMGHPVTGQGSVAADPKFVPLGAPVFLSMDRQDANGLWVAQDTGGAIKGANRFDTFWGAGDEARAIAGGMAARGTAWLLLPKGTLARLTGG
jgi:3D (Asp-Asp-Asp) domain-containing protein